MIKDDQGEDLDQAFAKAYNNLGDFGSAGPPNPNPYAPVSGADAVGWARGFNGKDVGGNVNVEATNPGLMAGGETSTYFGATNKIKSVRIDYHQYLLYHQPIPEDQTFGRFGPSARLWVFGN